MAASFLLISARRTACQPIAIGSVRTPSVGGSGSRLCNALGAHLDWVDESALAYRAILQGGISSDRQVQYLGA